MLEAWRAPRSRSAGLSFASPRAAAASRAASAPSAIWPTESRNLAATSSTSSASVRARPDLAPLGEGRHRRLDHERGHVAERDGGLARVGAEERPRRAGRERELRRGRARPGRAARARRSRAGRARQRGGQLGVERRVGVGRLGHVEDRERPVEGDGEEEAASGPATTIGSALSTASAPRSSSTVAAATRVVGRRRDEAQAPVARRLVERRAEQEGGEPVGGLDLALGERHRPARVEQLERTARAKRAVAAEAGEHVGFGSALARQQPGDEARARELAGHVVVEIRVQPAVARAELGCGADRQDGLLERAQAELQGCVGETGVQLVGVALAREPERLLVGDVEAAKRIERARVAGGDALDRLANVSLELFEQAPDRRGAWPSRCHGQPARPRARAALPAATLSSARTSAPLAAGRRARARGRSAPCRPPRAGCTRRPRSRRRCRS